MIADQESLQRKYDLLETLGDIVVAQNIIKVNEGEQGNSDEVPHPLDVSYRSLKNKLTPVAKGSDEWKWIETYTKNTEGHRKVEILDAFRMDREGELERFNKNKTMKNRKLLWHGTKVAVMVAILRGGLRIMPHAGGRVGRGLYFASENAKSAG